MPNRPIFPSGWSSMPMRPTNLSLANTLPVGQSFLWHRQAIPEAGPSEPKEEFSRAVRDPARVVLLRQSPSQLYYATVYPSDEDAERDRHRSVTKRWLCDYFQLGSHPELELLYQDWRRRDPDLFGKTETGSGRAIGVRVLRQDPWECLVAFITSTNNHISRISSLMHKLSRAYSPLLLSLDETHYHQFPSPLDLPTGHLNTALRQLGFGYRAAFLEASLTELQSKFGHDIEAGLLGWRKADATFVREELLALKGVGRKVADCVMLMCLDQASLIPIDTHIAAIAARHPSFPSRLRKKTMSKQVYEETQNFLVDLWGPFGGWAQAVMFAADLRIVDHSKDAQRVSSESKPDLDEYMQGSFAEEHGTAISPKRRLELSTIRDYKRTRSATGLDLETKIEVVGEQVVKVEFR